MIPKIGTSGTSFNGLANYLTHDPEAETSQRVAWTLTENLAADHVPSAVDEMLWTYRDAELLKQEAGIRAGGRTSEHPVKHISLNWAPSDNPSDQHMKDTARHFLDHMGWGEHQAIMVAHNDKTYKHLHIMLNEVHPETGLRLDDGFEKRRAQKWAYGYEHAQGQIHCEQRTLDPSDRVQNMPRNMWMAFKQNEQEFQKSEQQLKDLVKNPEIGQKKTMRPGDAQWEIFKEFQRDERDQFFAIYRERFSDTRNSIYRDVREEFREKWSNYYEQRKNAPKDQLDNFAALKKGLIAEQRSVFDPRREAAFGALKEQRNLDYRELLDAQAVTRQEFSWRVKAGLDNTDFFQCLGQEQEKRALSTSVFREAAKEVTRHAPSPRNEPVSRTDDNASEGRGQAGDRIATAADPGVFGRRAVVATVGGFLDALFTDVTNLGSASPTHEPEPGARDLFEVAAEEATKDRVAEERNLEETQRVKRSRTIYGE